MDCRSKVKKASLRGVEKAGFQFLGIFDEPHGLPDTNGDNAKLLTGASTKVTGGSKFHLKIQETVFHSGHYRVALAVNSAGRLDPKSPLILGDGHPEVGARP